MVAISTGGHDIIGIENRNRFWFELLSETLPVFDK
jgi:hypothetical protein